MAHALLAQVQHLEAACHRALRDDADPSARDALVQALAGYAIVPDDGDKRPYIRGLANMVRAHAEHLAHRLKTETEDAGSSRAQRVALDQVCHSLADLHKALVAESPA